jgi:transcriptional regulator with XRE-family HTH domain
MKKREKLVVARLRRGWSQEALAEKIGVTRNTVSAWERGMIDPYPVHVQRLCNVFATSVEELDLAVKHGSEILEESPELVETLPSSKQPGYQGSGFTPSLLSFSPQTPQFVSLALASKPLNHALTTPPDFSSNNPSSIIDAKLETDSSLEQKEFLPSVLTTVIAPPEDERGDWSIWFGLKVGQLITTIDHWQECVSSSDHLQAMLDQEIMLFDAMKPSQHHEGYRLSRRQALVTLAMLPTAQCTTLLQGLSSNSLVEKLLTRCAASITICWHLLKGSELALVEQILSTYLFTLVTLAQQPAPYRQTAAKLACQAYRLCGIVALHRNNLKARENYCQQALYFSEIAENPSLLVSAQISLASTFYYNKKPVPATHIYQKALLHEKEIPPLQRSRIYAELAVVSAQQEQEQEALRALGHAQQWYPDYPENDPSFLYADFSPASFILEEGLTYLALAQHYPGRSYKRQAWDSFSRIDTLAAIHMVPERIYFEIVNHQAAVALIQRDLEQVRTCLEKGIEGACLLHSKQRFQEAAGVYKQACAIWPHETNLKRLQDVFKTWQAS